MTRVEIKSIPLTRTKTLVTGGHAFITEYPEFPGIVKDFELGDYHGGPQCAKCGAVRCRWCDPDFMTEQCANQDETLPGLEYD